ncbi:hypothetical protein COE65_24890 [Bacillus sp. AFS051223]|uniref:hypothetical protein n=1 Tax=Bacillus sp. AFS051223 TaxID=2034280 RepID=UPI000BFE75E0|nr:hypothetical protein [Bacillus sp. AFS051223]PHA06671.1 hypothetical protein COE65_24890 [Bacillus sp. AFS051223]
MVFLKSTEQKFRMEGYFKCESIFNNKIEEQKRIFDGKAQEYSKNLEAKAQLIQELYAVLNEENTKTDNNLDFINTLESCINVIRKDTKTRLGYSANTLLRDKGIPTQIKFLE